ncbi:transmembrane protein 11, mitochondrial-like isoform X3 [Ambystoma mexicanum]|uniref:transmembrane protein 11, mitochondrial-like isoform X3 n=1 Tax=Ambystoma mexicanum TaxID=8296 RepID=UPI0037E71A17
MAALEGAERSGAPAPPLDFFVIHEIYDGDFTQAEFEAQLEAALEHQYRYIVIEPARLGDETARWIAVGNCLHRTSMLTGAVCLLSPLSLPPDFSHYLGLPAGAVSVACAALYGVSWQFDPCCFCIRESDQQSANIGSLAKTTVPHALYDLTIHSRDVQSLLSYTSLRRPKSLKTASKC